MSRHLNAYKRVRITTASPAELVVQLYEGLVRFTTMARRATEAQLHAEVGAAIDRTVKIIGHLRECLDMDAAPEVSPHLDRMYVAWTRAVVRAQITQDTALLDEVVTQMQEMLESWRRAAERTHVLAEGA